MDSFIALVRQYRRLVVIQRTFPNRGRLKRIKEMEEELGMELLALRRKRPAKQQEAAPPMDRFSSWGRSVN